MLTFSNSLKDYVQVLRLLSDLLCAEIAEFFLEIVTRLTTLLLLYLQIWQFNLSHVILWMLC